MKRVILASTSPRRKELLMQIIDDFEVIAPQGEEKEFCTPEQTAEKNAQVKGRSVIAKTDDQSIIIACDTVVAKGGKILGKPVDKKHAMEMLKELRNSWHQVYSGVYIKAGMEYCYFEKSEVFIHNLTDKQVCEYIDKYRPYDKAGSYGIQDKGIVKEYRGDYNNIVGLPLEKLRKILRENGTDVKK